MRSREAGDPDTGPFLGATLHAAHVFETPLDLEPLVRRLSSVRVALLGEASHGTHEYYDWRRVLSRELILHHGFRFIAVEGDWPACRELDRYVRGQSEAASAREALSAFHRWPTWMWAKEEIHELAEWLRSFNRNAPRDRQVGFHGLDVYSLFESIDAALAIVKRVSPFLARRLAARFACFGPYARDEKAYARSLLQFPAGCREEVARNLADLLAQRLGDPDELFDARQNARVVASAEDYYRTMVHGTEDSWNVRDRHMLETLTLLLDRYGPGARGIVWAHNTHVGDHRHTDMILHGQVNLGGLARAELGEERVALVGFGSHEGTVIASRAWDGPTQRMVLPPGAPGSVEDVFHAACAEMHAPRFWLDLRPPAVRRGALAERRGHRAVGVVYQPEHERLGNYVPTQLALRYDAFLFFDRTRALDPLPQDFDRSELPDTWPTGT